jgi:hypothetical protein
LANQLGQSFSYFAYGQFHRTKCTSVYKLSQTLCYIGHQYY